jgi:hypothetical protein
VDDSGRRLFGYGLVALLAAFTYLHGLDSQHIPKNGDEYPYAHITRLTAESGRLLPLRSDLPGMRNTKPPLLFWQGIASTGWGRHWALWNLRYPSVVYTLLTAVLVFLLGLRLSGRAETGFVAALSFLAFFSTYRYGRPFLTNPPEVFWLFLPFFALLYWRKAAPVSRFVFPLVAGVAIGIALLYKSFALVVPAGLGLAGWYLHSRGYRLAAFLARDSWKVLIALFVSLALFGAWFLLDPDPGAVWREFVLGENLGKFDRPGGYLPRLLWGSSSLWTLALSYPLNAGLLFFPVVALFVLAVLLGLAWQRIPLFVLASSQLASAAVVSAIAYLSLCLQEAVPGPRLYPVAHWVLLAGAVGIALAALGVRALVRPTAHAAVFLCTLSLASFLRPFDGPLGRYDEGARAQVRGRTVWVPADFIAKEEGYRFLLPGADVRAYREDRGTRAEALLAEYPLVAIRRSLRDKDPVTGRVLGQRLDLRGRHTTREIVEMLRGEVLVNLLVREQIVETPAGAAGPR